MNQSTHLCRCGSPLPPTLNSPRTCPFRDNPIHFTFSEDATDNRNTSRAITRLVIIRICNIVRGFLGCLLLATNVAMQTTWNSRWFLSLTQPAHAELHPKAERACFTRSCCHSHTCAQSKSDKGRRGFGNLQKYPMLVVGLLERDADLFRSG